VAGRVHSPLVARQNVRWDDGICAAGAEEALHEEQATIAGTRLRQDACSQRQWLDRTCGGMMGSLWRVLKKPFMKNKRQSQELARRRTRAVSAGELSTTGSKERAGRWLTGLPIWKRGAEVEL
jgi:hypothetical protein